MGLFDTFKGLVSNLNNEVAKFQNADFLDATIASAIAVSAADGTIDSSEKDKLIKFVSVHDSLKLFKSSDVAAIATKYIDLFSFDNGIGMQAVLKSVAKLQGKEDQATTMVLVACAIGNADGDFDDSEKAVVRKIAQEVGLSPSKFNV